jgi:hypothetical protein
MICCSSLGVNTTEACSCAGDAFALASSCGTRLDSSTFYSGRVCVFFIQNWLWHFIIHAQTCQHHAAGPCTKSCSMDWNKCGGYIKTDDASMRMDARCCDPESHCVQEADGYAECRPKTRPVPDAWEGIILECGMIIYKQVLRRNAQRRHSIGTIS